MAKENHNNNNNNNKRNKLPRDACDYKCNEPASERKFGAGAGAVKIYVAAVEALRKKERQMKLRPTLD